MSAPASDTTPEARATARLARKKAVVDGKIAAASIERGVLLVNTGTGKGKSSAAFGVLARALGHGQHCAVVQFVKARSDTGESAFFQRQPEMAGRWHVMGEGFTWETQDPARDAAAARAAWQQACTYLTDGCTDLLILDEFTYALKYGWLTLDEVLPALQARPATQHVIITGRAAPEALLAVADTATDMHLLKHAFQAGIKAMPGLEY